MQQPVAGAGPFGIHAHRPAASEYLRSGIERASSAGRAAASQRDLPSRAKDPRRATPIEVLRLGQERHRPIHCHRHEDRIHERAVVGRQDAGTVGETFTPLDPDVIRPIQRATQNRFGDPITHRARVSIHDAHLPTRRAPMVTRLD